nr:CocE/NonD family hydrolase C-terminal non-catalytic domain-containing protein [Sphingomonas sp. CFBP 13728]
MVGAAMDRTLADPPLKVRTMIVDGLGEQEDSCGAPAVYRALEAKDDGNDMVYRTMAPWYDGQGIFDGSAVGAIGWDADTAKWWRWNVPLKYGFAPPTINHVFLPGHKIMVQVQSSRFPLHDRNPHTFVPNIVFAEPEYYVKAMQGIAVAGPDRSHISLPVVK